MASTVALSRKRRSSLVLSSGSTSTAVSTYESSSDSDDYSHLESSSTETRKKTRSQKVYKQAYRSEWEQQEDLKGWLTRSRTKSGMAFCKFCNCTLEAKLCDLRRHMTTKKHIDNKRLLSEQQTLLSCTSKATSLNTQVSISN